MENVSPFELWYKKRPRINHLRIVGSTCYIHVPDQKRKKLYKKAMKGYLVGYDGEARYRVYIKDTNSVQLSRDVNFLESIGDVKNETGSTNKTDDEMNEDNLRNIIVKIKPNDTDDMERVNCEYERDCEDFYGFEDAQQDADVQSGDTESIQEYFEDAVQDAEPLNNNEPRISNNRKEDGIKPNTKCLRYRTIIIDSLQHNDIILISREFINKI